MTGDEPERRLLIDRALYHTDGRVKFICDVAAADWTKDGVSLVEIKLPDHGRCLLLLARMLRFNPSLRR